MQTSIDAVSPVSPVNPKATTDDAHQAPHEGEPPWDGVVRTDEDADRIVEYARALELLEDGDSPPIQGRLDLSQPNG